MSRAHNEVIAHLKYLFVETPQLFDGGAARDAQRRRHAELLLELQVRFEGLKAVNLEDEVASNCDLEGLKFDVEGSAGGLKQVCDTAGMNTGEGVGKFGKMHVLQVLEHELEQEPRASRRGADLPEGAVAEDHPGPGDRRWAPGQFH